MKLRLRWLKPQTKNAETKSVDSEGFRVGGEGIDEADGGVVRDDFSNKTLFQSLVFTI